MKRTKKLLALVLAMMMAFSMLTMPAMAANIMPLASSCGACGGGLEESVETTTVQIRVGGCAKTNISHTYIRKTLYSVTTCKTPMCTRGTVKNFMGTADDCLYPQ